MAPLQSSPHPVVIQYPSRAYGSTEKIIAPVVKSKTGNVAVMLLEDIRIVRKSPPVLVRQGDDAAQWSSSSLFAMCFSC
ncbi:hypothetical protein Aduo_016716 [Ancylostoma duodenale]